MKGASFPSSVLARVASGLVTAGESCCSCSPRGGVLVPRVMWLCPRESPLWPCPRARGHVAPPPVAAVRSHRALALLWLPRRLCRVRAAAGLLPLPPPRPEPLSLDRKELTFSIDPPPPQPFPPVETPPLGRGAALVCMLQLNTSLVRLQCRLCGGGLETSPAAGEGGWGVLRGRTESDQRSSQPGVLSSGCPERMNSR